jgi:hypothetical protein
MTILPYDVMVMKPALILVTDVEYTYIYTAHVLEVTGHKYVVIYCRLLLRRCPEIDLFKLNFILSGFI